MWLQEQLINLYPDLHILYNDRQTIGSELDIYIPSLNLAFEINGIFHYEPIFGKDKLNRIITNDSNKYKSCLDNEVDLCIINSSKQSYFSPKTSFKYLNIIVNIMEDKLLK